MKKLALAAAALLAVPTLVLAGQTFTQYGLERAQAEDTFFQFVYNGEVPMLWLPDGVKALPPQQRAALVKEVGAFARTFFGSELFATRWEGARTSAAPLKPEPPKDGAAIVAAQKAEVAKSIREMEEALKQMPAEHRAAMKEAVAEMKRMQAETPFSPEMAGQGEELRYQEELRRYREELERMPPADPKVALARALESFLDLTKDLDFKARLVNDGGLKRFADPRLEAKPSEWKACFRAGREPVEAARGVAKAWLAELRGK